MDIKSSQKGLKEGDERFNVITKSSIIEDIKSIAYWDRALIKDVATSALKEYIERWKEEHPDMPLRSDK